MHTYIVVKETKDLKAEVLTQLFDESATGVRGIAHACDLYMHAARACRCIYIYVLACM